MHVPDGFLSGGVAALTWGAAAGSILAAIRRERRAEEPMPAGILGSVAAFLFAAQMINVPVAPGTSGHLVGATLAAVLLGPWRACLAMSAVLAVQALIFQDGGIAAYGANVLDMAVAGPFVGFAVASIAGRLVRGPRGAVVGGVLGGFAATVTGATLVAVWLGLSGLYPLGGILPVLVVSHVVIGLLEAALTGAILVTLLTWRPDLAAALAGPAARRPATMAAGVFGFAVALALIAGPWASTRPDGLQAAANTLGFADRARAAWPALAAMRDLPWARFVLGAPGMAGALGTGASALLAWAISRSLAVPGDETHR